MNVNYILMGIIGTVSGIIGYLLLKNTGLIGTGAGLIKYLRQIKFMRTKPYQFDLIMMSPGVNHHYRIEGDSLEFEHIHDGKKYQVKADRLYRVRVGKPTSLWFMVKGIKKRFLIAFHHKKTKPIEPVDIKVTARVLKEVNESRALGKALRSEFRVPFDLKKILLIMGFVVVVVIAYVMVMGGGLTI